MEAVFRRLASERLFRWLLGVALALPLFLSRGPNGAISGPPLVTSGDEPHYVAMLHSLVSDHDLDLLNNYNQARLGSVEVGAGRIGVGIDHQVAWYDSKGVFWGWVQVYDYERNAKGKPVPPPALPQRLPGAPSEFDGKPQYSQHPPGLPLLLAPLVYPARGTAWVEHLAIFWTTLATLATALLFRELLRGISDNRGLVNTTTLLMILGSPIWHYGRMLFSEAWLALCAVGALTFATRKNAFFVAGLFVAVGVQMKPPFALLAVPLFVDRLLARDVKRAATFALPIVLSVALIFVENQLFWGAPLHSAQRWTGGNLLTGTIGGLFSMSHGLIPYCPAVLVALAGFPALFRTHRREAWLIVGIVGPYCILIWSWFWWWGGSCYGPRLIVPIIPLFFVGALKVFESLKQLSEPRQRLVTALCSLSVLISAIGAIVHLVFWEKHPLIEPWVQLAKHI
ncbi:MAG TPA: hypothetical protein VER96_36240 [Polyangiaceae bacterium]|nr:hypothetical protein [Polyangiaceae bacterium]